jgi:hypothetical protein
MERWLPEIVGAVLGLFGQIVIAAYVYGKLTQATVAHGHRLMNIEGEQVRQWQSLDAHGQRIAKIEGAHRHE